jgi:hypothetical protein
MFDPNEITKKQAIRLASLMERQTRAEIMARLSPLGGEDNTDYFMMKLKAEDKMRELLFGTADMVELGLQWELIKPRKQKPKSKTVKEIEDFFDGQFTKNQKSHVRR